MENYLISPDGNTLDYPFRKKEDLKSWTIYVFLSHTQQKIFLWNGKQTNARYKYTASQIAQEMRSQLGYSYRVITIDEEFETTLRGS